HLCRRQGHRRTASSAPHRPEDRHVQRPSGPDPAGRLSLSGLTVFGRAKVLTARDDIARRFRALWPACPRQERHSLSVTPSSVPSPCWPWPPATLRKPPKRLKPNPLFLFQRPRRLL